MNNEEVHSRYDKDGNLLCIEMSFDSMKKEEGALSVLGDSNNWLDMVSGGEDIKKCDNNKGSSNNE